MNFYIGFGMGFSLCLLAFLAAGYARARRNKATANSIVHNEESVVAIVKPTNGGRPRVVN
jgi:hypothetical protein